jgi:hypothetical protein
MDQKIAMNTAINGLSNTDRYQMENPGNQPYKASGAAPGSSAEASQMNLQNNILSTVRDNLANQKIAGFADGGQIKETPEQLIARISGKYGVSGSSSPNQVLASPAQTQQPSAQKPQSIGLLPNQTDVLKRREAAAGLANGGKIKGPGTQTSDSIPAQVRQTGEPIQVSTGERIVSADQDSLLQKIAQGIGFKNLDALLEHGTGKKVGPTIKAGKMAAAHGFSSIPSEEEVARATAERDAEQIASQRGFASANTDQSVKPIAGLPVQSKPALTKLILGDSAPQRSSVTPAVGQKTFGVDYGTAAPTSAPQQRIGTLPTANQPMIIGADNYRPNPAQNGIGDGVFTQDGKTYRQQATGQAGISKITSPGTSPLFTNLDGGAAVSGLKSRSSPELFAGADGKPTTHWNETQDYKDAIARNERNAVLAKQMERDRYGRDMQSDVTDPRAIALARLNLDRMNTEQAGENQAQQVHQQAITAGLDQQLKRGTLASNDKITQMIGQLDNPALTPEQRSDVRSNVLVAQGKNPNEHRFIPLDETVYDDMGRPTSKTGFALDTLTGNRMGGGQKQSLPAPKSESEMRALPKGTKYTAPDGSVRIKP